MNKKTIDYKGLEWYIIKETDKEKLLFLKECFSNEMIERLFDKYNQYHVDYYTVKFSYGEFYKRADIDKWWEYSYIRKILNGPFLNFLDIKDLNVMTSNIILDNEISIPEDYVRLLTKEEVEYLPIEILKSKVTNAYWTMNPIKGYGLDIAILGVYGTNDNPKELATMSPYSYGAIRPVISLKQEEKEQTEIMSEYTEEYKQMLIKRFNDAKKLFC